MQSYPITQFHFFPLQFRKNSYFPNLNSLVADTQLLVAAKKANENKQCINLQIQNQNHDLLKLKIIQGFLLIEDLGKGEIIEIIQTNFDIKFEIIQYKAKNSVSFRQTFSQISSHKFQKVLIFSFKSFNHVKIQFLVPSHQKQPLGRFVDSLSKIAIDSSDFHKRYRPIQKISCSQNHSIIRSKDLMMCRQIMVNALRKEGLKSNIWRDLQYLGQARWFKGSNLLQVMGFYETSNSIYITFQKFDYYLQNYSRRLNQQYQSFFSSQYYKKIVHVLEIITKIIPTLNHLHSAGISMNGTFNQPNLVFQQTNGSVNPKLNPFLEHIIGNNYLNHKKMLQQKINFIQERGNYQPIPPQLLDVNQWKYLNQVDYLNHMKKADIFGLGNLLHELLFGRSLFGKRDNEGSQKNRGSIKIVLAPQISQLKHVCPQIVELILSMTESDLKLRISLPEVQAKVGEIMKIIVSKPKTSCQIGMEGQTQFLKQNQKFSKYGIQNTKQLFSEAENKIANKQKKYCSRQQSRESHA